MPATGVARDVEEAGRLRARMGTATRVAKSAEASSTKEALLAVEEGVERGSASRPWGSALAVMSRRRATRGSACEKGPAWRSG